MVEVLAEVLAFHGSFYVNRIVEPGYWCECGERLEATSVIAGLGAWTQHVTASRPHAGSRHCPVRESWISWTPHD